ncbi:Major facilitator superfamily transporter protein [Rutstroemia sp. NJR-2017a BBW]|nr:Major facilitator superfamily transporter protein [Rutstroemia sp. NJR-2017a BBW]
MAFQDTDECNLPMLSEEENEKSIPFTTSPPPQRRRKICSILLIGLASSVLFALSITWASHFITLPTNNHNPHIIKSPCGNSSSEAKARGCHFDVLSFCWVPDQCFDRELTEKFRKAGPWVFYTDMNKTASVSEEQFGSDTQPVYLTNKLHKTHCAYNILRFHKALTEGRMVHKEDVLTHTEHCSQVLTRINDPDDIEVRAKIQYPDCGHFSRDFPGKAKDGPGGHSHHHGHSNMG